MYTGQQSVPNTATVGACVTSVAICALALKCIEKDVPAVIASLIQLRAKICARETALRGYVVVRVYTDSTIFTRVRVAFVYVCRARSATESGKATAPETIVACLSHSEGKRI
eukprot:SAG31_NODE_194_length_20722_cov_19.854192_23_plen_112_part_00